MATEAKMAGKAMDPRGKLATRSHRRAYIRRILNRTLFQLVVTVAAIAFGFPLFWLILCSLKTNPELLRFPPAFWPERFIWGNWPRTIAGYPFLLYYRNTIFLASNAALGTMAANALVGYGFSRIQWRGRGFFYMLCLSTMMLPGAVTMIPVYVIWRKLGAIGTWWPLTLGAWFANPYSTFLLAQFFRTIPQELGDAARVDGCSEFGIFWRIFLPLCKPALAVVGLFAFTGTWSDVMGPLIYIQKTSMYTLTLGLKVMQDNFWFSGGKGSDWAGMMVGSALAALPIVVLFFFTQKVFIEGITFTGIKG